MNWQFKKIISILFALLIGTTIVFFSWKNVGDKGEEASLSAVENEDWRATLNVAPQDGFVKTLSPTGKNIDILATEATTTTTILGQRLLTEFISSQTKSTDGTLRDEEVLRISNLLAQEVVAPQEKQYKLSDLNISTDNSREANIKYIDKANALAKDQMAIKQADTEINIVVSAMNSGDEDTLVSKLTIREKAWRQLIDNLLALKVPSSVAPIHLHLVQSCELLRSATVDLEKSLIDPVAGLAALSKYSNGLTEFDLTRQEYLIFYKTL